MNILQAVALYLKAFIFRHPAWLKKETHSSGRESGSGLVEKPTPHEKTDIFVYDRSPKRASVPGNDDFLDSTSTFICFQPFGIDEPTRLSA